MVFGNFRTNTINLLLVILSLPGLFLGATITHTAKAEQEIIKDWKLVSPLNVSSTGLNYPRGFYCFNSNQPSELLVQWIQRPAGTRELTRYNWVTDQKTTINQPFNTQGDEGFICNNYNSLVYYRLNGSEKAVRFALTDGKFQEIEHFPDFQAQDGSQQVYSIDKAQKLWSSPNGGLDWQSLALPTDAYPVNMVVAHTNSQAIYVLAKDKPQTTFSDNYAIYFSTNAGRNWEKRSSFKQQNSSKLAELSGHFSDIDTFEIIYQGPGAMAGSGIFLTTDGGRTFRAAGRITGSPFYVPTEIYQTSTGLLRFEPFGESSIFEVSRNQGQTWTAIKLPFTVDTSKGPVPQTLVQARYSPDEFFYTNLESNGSTSLWRSNDGGVTWQKMGSNLPKVTDTTPYIPTSLLGIQNDNLYVMDYFATDKSLTSAVADPGVENNIYFPTTGHNLNGVFKTYWETQGGLAQFGYPKTEAFREYNPTDGKIYTVQYFERNRFEYHPENKGTQYEVLLGLLGSQLTEQRRAGEPAFKPVSNPGEAGVLFFPEVGHTLRGPFRTYWEKNGGLAMYGYPVSEQFEELNSEDNKTYVVQYFERNRFEYHPENKGTQYEVLLGLLGNSILKQKTWL